MAESHNNCTGAGLRHLLQACPRSLLPGLCIQTLPFHLILSMTASWNLLLPDGSPSVPFTVREWQPGMEPVPWTYFNPKHACHRLFHTCQTVFFPGGASGKEPTCQCRRLKRRGFDPWAGTIPWRRKWYPTLVFLPEESHGQRSLGVYSLWVHKESTQLKQLSKQAEGFSTTNCTEHKTHKQTKSGLARHQPKTDTWPESWLLRWLIIWMQLFVFYLFM